MDLGLLCIGADMSVAQLARLAKMAEDHGFASMNFAEAWRSGFVPMTAAAAATDRIRIGSYVLNAYGRSPMLAGMSAIDLNEYSGGRLMLGVGGGNRIINEQWQGTPHERVLTKMREYVELLKLMARTRLGERLHFKGKVHSMDWTAPIDPLEKPFPVYLAAVFPRMMRVAAQVADGIGAGATLSSEYISEILKARAAEAASAVDRDPTSLRWTTAAIVAADEDRERARRAARESICRLYAPLPHPYYEYTMREQGFDATVDQLLQLMPAAKNEAAIAAIPDECVDRLTIAGTVEDCQKRIASYEGVVDELVLLNAMPVTDGDPEPAYRAALRLTGTS